MADPGFPVKGVVGGGGGGGVAFGGGYEQGACALGGVPLLPSKELWGSANWGLRSFASFAFIEIQNHHYCVTRAQGSGNMKDKLG